MCFRFSFFAKYGFNELPENQLKQVQKRFSGFFYSRVPLITISSRLMETQLMDS